MHLEKHLSLAKPASRVISRPARAVSIACLALALSMCTEPYVVSISQGGVAINEVDVEFESREDLQEFFDDDSQIQLEAGGDDFTIDAAEVDDAEEYHWYVGGDRVENGDGEHFQLGENGRSLTIRLSSGDFEEEYPVGTSFDVMLSVVIASDNYSGSRSFLVAESSA